MGGSLLSSTQCPLGLERWSQSQPLGEGVGVEGNGIGSVVHGQEVPDVPGPEAGPAQGRGVSQLHQGEAGEGVLGLDLSALGQCQKET